ncbi:hypothetical protein C8Q76DRAFT_266330 [Earliella scabrosa]|nr:hypothetical protein C8Q76DRAFT_266330 [Earliella scabrosa]
MNDPYVAFRRHDRRHSSRDYTRVEVIYYRLKLSEPPPAPRPALVPLPNDIDNRIEVCQPSSSKLQQPTIRERRHSEPSSPPHQRKRRRVHFADELRVHNYDPEDRPARQPSPIPPPVPPKPSPPRGYPSSTAPHTSTKPSTGLHDILISFPPRLWDVRRRASPLYDPHHQSRFSEPVFPSRPSMPALRLAFVPCSRTELAWLHTVPVPPFRTHLVVEDVLRAVSTELLRRSACWDLYADHPCFARAVAAQQVRAREGHTDTPFYEDGIRNVDLYHLEREGAYGPLWFRGLKEETLRGGEVVYRVVLSYA